MSTQLDNNTSALQGVLTAINSLPSASVTSVNGQTGRVVLTAGDIEAGTFKGEIIAGTSSQTPTTSLLRNSKLVTTTTNPSNNGEIYWTYG